MNISKDKFEKLKNNANWQLQGDSFERKYGHLVVDTFPNIELFWQQFVVPSTGRIHTEANFIRQPEAIDTRVSVIGNHNYVIFQHLIKCYHLIDSQDCFAVDDFYSHLVSVLDNFEQLVEKLVLLLSDYNPSLMPEFLTKLSKDDFVRIMQDWYENNYSNLLRNYRSRKNLSINLQKLTTESFLQQIFDKKKLKKYITFSQEVRQTRNLYVHGVRIGNIVFPNLNLSFQPKHSKILSYRDDYRKVFDVKNDPEKFNQDFIEVRTQMREDICKQKELLNILYETLLELLQNLPDNFYQEIFAIRFTK